jgi:hypothetical protein
MKINSRSTRALLSSIRIGDQIEDDRGNSGKVSDIEMFTKHSCSEYYFRLKKAKTILIIK